MNVIATQYCANLSQLTSQKSAFGGVFMIRFVNFILALIGVQTVVGIALYTSFPDERPFSSHRHFS